MDTKRLEAFGDGVRLTYAIVFVSDMERSVAFYRDVLGLPLRFRSPGWTEFDTGGATLALHAADGPASAGRPGPDLPPGRCRPGLSVTDLDAFHARVEAQGVPCVQEPEDLFGARIAQYADPDGLTVSVAEERKR
jgi:lactoylglutathione lyase